MVTNNRKAVTPELERISFERTARTLRNGAIHALEQLHAEGRPDLSAPFAEILKVLAAVDYAALAALDKKAAQS